MKRLGLRMSYLFYSISFVRIFEQEAAKQNESGIFTEIPSFWWYTNICLEVFTKISAYFIGIAQVTPRLKWPRVSH